MAKIADVFGRVNAYVLSVVLYVLGESLRRLGAFSDQTADDPFLHQVISSRLRRPTST